LRVVGVQASPNKDGLTSKLVKAVLRGARGKNGETELIHLNELSLKSCTACDSGWGICKDEGTCVLDDGFQGLVDKIAKCDGFVFATPVYWHDLSESAKIFLDRLRRCETGKDFQTFAGKKAIGIASAGGSGRGAVRALYNLEAYLRRLDFNILDLVPVTRFSKDHKLKMLERVGELLVETYGT
jgi:multimeric flavodoxin WrbA